MSKLEIRQKQRIRNLEEALRPFAEIVVPTEGDVWFYVGVAQEGFPAELHTRDFTKARVAMGIIRIYHK